MVTEDDPGFLKSFTRKELIDLMEAGTLEPNDVILGRGFRFAWHSGNNAFQALVQSYIPLYDAATRKADKSRVVQRIYDKVIERGRFVKKDFVLFQMPMQ